ncbi:DUF6531 domain-containing protein [Streptomyces sp. 7N604]|uniref:DUF6531 domain-containing protein n=1 Tax=Streptomyces sp. 7N604 TaxID=3457415 RepID=UPI003FD5F66A
MGYRPTDWHVLDLESDPVPGDPERVKGLARRLHAFADDVGDALRQIKGMAEDDALLKWAGKSADAFTSEFEDVPKNLRKLKKSYDLAGDALAAYWPELEKAQDDSKRALEKGREARRDLSTANTRLESANDWVDRAGKKAKEYEDSGKKKDVPPPDEKEVRAATRNHTQAQESQRDAQTAVDNAQSALDAAKKMAADAKKLREDAATKAKKKLEEASDAGIQNRSWWEEAVDWVSDNWDTIVAVCKVVVAIVGIIAMIIGGPILAAIVVVAALVVLADTINKYLKGQATLLDVAFAALDCIPGMKGLTTLGGLARGLKGMAKGLRSGGLKALRKGADDAIGKSKPTNGRCKGGDPIDMVSGEMLMEETDVELPGLLPLVLRRTHVSTYRWGRWFGESWASTIDERLELDNDGALFATEDGMILVYPVPAPGTSVMPLEGPRWPLDWDGEPGAPIRITDPRTGHTRHFAPLAKPAPADSAFTMPLAAISDRNGHRIEFDRDEFGAPTAVRHSGGYHVHVDTEDDRITRLRLANPEDGPDGTTLLRYGYNAEGHLTEIYNSSGLPFKLSYDDRARITSWTDRNNSWYRFTYDDQDRCIRGEGADGFLSCTITYDTENRETRYTNSLGHTTTHHYNELLQRTAVTDPRGNTERSEWDRYSRLLSRTDPLGHLTSFSYDDAGNLTAIHYPDGTTETAVYNHFHQPIVVTETDGAEWRHTYDERGNRIETTNPAGHRTRYIYDDQGRPSEVVDALGRSRRFTSSAAGLIIVAVDPLGNSASIERDAFGRAEVVEDALGRVARMSWTVEGRLQRRNNHDGSHERWSWDGEGNLLEHTDSMGRVTRHEITHFDLTSSRTGIDGKSYGFVYDTELRLIGVTNPQGLSWSYTYDEAGRLVSETDFNGRNLEYDHDAAGHLTSRVNGGSERISFTRDVMGRTTGQTTVDGDTTYEYDRAGRLIRATNTDTDLVIDRDILGRILVEKTNGYATSYTYDLIGRRISRKTPSGHISTWTYDDADRPVTLDSAGRTLDFRHDAAGRETDRRLGNAFALTQTWDVADRLIGQKATAHPGISDELLEERAYSYHEDGRLAEIKDRSTGTRRFGLDASGRVTTVNARGWTERYAYDGSGNVSHAEAPGEEAGSGFREFTGTLIKRAGRSSYEHDAQGRLVRKTRRLLNGQKRTWIYIWNSEDRLTETITPDGHHWHYCYDPIGRRVAKRRITEDGVVVRETLFSWDGTRLAEQVDEAGQVLTWDYTPGSHQPLTQTAGQEDYDARFYAIITDLIGTPTELVDEDGDVVWRRHATVWGSTLSEAPGLVDCPLRFPGQYADPETGHHYNYFRHYDPETARYISPDPLGLEPAPNHHAYVATPTQASDPLGLAPDCPPGMDPEFPTIRLDNYRGRFQAALHRDGRQRLPADWDAHHAIPQEYRGHPEFADFDFDHPSNMRGILGSRSGSRATNHHQDITNHWADFRAANPNATRAEIESFARTIDEGYRDYYW